MIKRFLFQFIMFNDQAINQLFVSKGISLSKDLLVSCLHIMVMFGIRSVPLEPWLMWLCSQNTDYARQTVLVPVYSTRSVHEISHLQHMYLLRDLSAALHWYLTDRLTPGSQHRKLTRYINTISRI